MKDIREILQTFLSRKRNVRFLEMQKLLLEVGFAMRQQKRGGSHFVFRHQDVNILVVLVSHGKNDLLPEYQVMKAIRAIEKLLMTQEN